MKALKRLWLRLLKAAGVLDTKPALSDRKPLRVVPRGANPPVGKRDR